MMVQYGPRVTIALALNASITKDHKMVEYLDSLNAIIIFHNLLFLALYGDDYEFKWLGGIQASFDHSIDGEDLCSRQPPSHIR